MQFFSHANALEHLRRALAYYSDGTTIAGKESDVRDTSPKAPAGGLGLRTPYDQVRAEAYAEAKNLSEPSQHRAQGNIDARP